MFNPCITEKEWQAERYKKKVNHIRKIKHKARLKGELLGFWLSLGKAIQGQKVDNKFLKTEGDLHGSF